MKTFFRKDRKKSPFGVTFQRAGKQARRFFMTKADRDAWIAAHHLAETVEEFSLVEWMRWMGIKRECERVGLTPEDMVARFRHRRQVSGKLVSEAVTDFLAVKERESSSEYYDHLRHALEDQLAVAAADMLLGDVTADHLRRLFDEMDYHPVTMRNKIAYLKAFFRWCVRERYLVEDPTAHLKAPKIINEEVGILTPAQGKALMKAAAGIDGPFAARVALQAFAGLRAANAIRLEVEEIDFNARTILIPAAKFKTGKRHLIEAGELRNLWTWLDPVQDEDWTITAKQYRYRLGKAYSDAGIDPPKNALRHSFATYKCAVDGEAGKASYILGHGNPREIWQSYKGVASAEAGREWFRI